MSISNGRLDKISIAAAGICLLHCVLVPVVVGLLSLTLQQPESPWIEPGLLLTSLIIGGQAIWKGYKYYHRQKKVVLLFLIGIAFLFAGFFSTTLTTEALVKFLGTSLLIGTHLYNWRTCKSCASNS